MTGLATAGRRSVASGRMRRVKAERGCGLIISSAPALEPPRGRRAAFAAMSTLDGNEDAFELLPRVEKQTLFSP